VRACFHHGDGGGFADAAGDNDKRQIECALLKNFERGETIECGIENPKSRCPNSFRERGTHGGGGIDALERDVVTAPPQFTQEQFRVVFRVFNE
jgi:hypothetical protein